MKTTFVVLAGMEPALPVTPPYVNFSHCDGFAMGVVLDVNFTSDEVLTSRTVTRAPSNRNLSKN
jgi:hypothetical protein